MKRYLKWLMNIVFSATLVWLLIGVKVNAETEIPKDVLVNVDGQETMVVHGLTVGYENNTYVSLHDLQCILSGTEKAFNLSLEEDAIVIELGEETDAALSGAALPGAALTDVALTEETHGWTEEEKNHFTNRGMMMKRIKLNGEERKYYTISMSIGDHSDSLISIIDFCMLFDIQGERVEDVWNINASQTFQVVNPVELEEDGYFLGVNSVLVGDATTGEIFYGYHEKQPYPIASTTKLMTYLLVAEAMERDEITEDDLVPISRESELLSKTSDGLTPMKEGQKISVKELLEGALIVSSNECDHAVSEYLFGDEETIVAAMNERASMLSMSTAEFYSCNGLPVYSNHLVASKKQNHMSSEDMFRLASYLLSNFPQIKDITSMKEANLETLKKEIKNTNPLLYNLPEVTGLKTGTTNKSGACLVSSLTVNDGYTDHDLVVVLLGAENNQDRGRVSELLARYGKAVIRGECANNSYSLNSESDLERINANSFVTMIVNRAMQLKRENNL